MEDEGDRIKGGWGEGGESTRWKTISRMNLPVSFPFLLSLSFHSLLSLLAVRFVHRVPLSLVRFLSRFGLGSSEWRGYKASGAERYVIRYSFFRWSICTFYLRPRNKFGNKLREHSLPLGRASEGNFRPWRGNEAKGRRGKGRRKRRDEPRGDPLPRFNRHVRARHSALAAINGRTGADDGINGRVSVLNWLDFCSETRVRNKHTLIL